jgi:hypothetical protein
VPTSRCQARGSLRLGASPLGSSMCPFWHLSPRAPRLVGATDLSVLRACSDRLTGAGRPIEKAGNGSRAANPPFNGLGPVSKRCAEPHPGVALQDANEPVPACRTAIFLPCPSKSPNSPVCQRSALHGLGEWFKTYPVRVERIIDEYLENKSVHPKLRAYALGARCGKVP